MSFSPKSEKPQGGRPSTDYQLTLDMAKELSMVENNEQGRMARRYFIEMERKVLDSIGTQVPQAHENVASLPDIEHRAFAGRNVLIARFDGQPWFSAGNLCTALNLGSSDRIVRSLPARHKRKLERGSRKLWMVDAEGAFRAADYCKPGTDADYRDWLSGIVKGRDIGIDCARATEPTAPARPAPVASLPDTPEAFFSQPPNLEPGLPIDAINCQIRRTDATVALLISQFDGTCEGRLSDTHIANALWAVQGDLERLHALFSFGWRASRTAA